MAQNRYEALPDFILNAPELYDCDMPLFDAYVYLDTCRVVSLNGGGSIPWHRVVQYGEYMELTGDDLDDFISIITLTDNLVNQKQQEDTT